MFLTLVLYPCKMVIQSLQTPPEGICMPGNKWVANAFEKTDKVGRCKFPLLAEYCNFEEIS